MKLYYTPGACSLAPHIVLREGGFRFELEKVDLASKKTESGKNFLELNPKGYVPALQLDNGDLLTETAVIVQYLADQRPGGGLVADAGTIERYRLQEWLNFIAAELHKSLAQLFNAELPTVAQQMVRDNVAKKFTYVDGHLQGKDYLLGGRFSIVDSYAFAIINWKNFFDIDLAPWPNLAQYFERVGNRPFVQAALKAEGLLDQ